MWFAHPPPISLSSLSYTHTHTNLRNARHGGICLQPQYSGCWGRRIVLSFRSGKSEIPAHPQLYSEFEANMDYMELHLIKINKQKSLPILQLVPGFTGPRGWKTDSLSWVPHHGCGAVPKHLSLAGPNLPGKSTNCLEYQVQN